jgi:photosystem II stability/assembly factor-like uncharacterized protein
MVIPFIQNSHMKSNNCLKKEFFTKDIIILSLFMIALAGLLVNCSDQSKGKTDQPQNPNGRYDSWDFVGAGGGGAMFNPTVSPHDPDYAYVRCDMTGAYVTYNGGESWRMFNLRSPVRWFVFDPKNPDVIYANSIALYRSTDRGKTWSIIYPDPKEISAIVSRGDHASEVVVNLDNTRKNVSALAVDPSNSDKLYACISSGRENALYISEDFGVSWTKDKDLEEGAKNIFVDPSSPKKNRTIYLTGRNSITCREKGIWTTNAGPADIKTLTEYAGGFDRSSRKFIIYATSGRSYFNSANEKSGIHYTEDGGKTWENRQEGLMKYNMEGAATPEWRSIGTSANHPGVVYVSYNTLKVADDTTFRGVAKSEDFGKTWTLAWKDAVTKEGSFSSVNLKTGWIEEQLSPTWGGIPFALGVSPADPDICYGTDFGRTIKTVDGGKTWEQLYAKRKEGAGWISRGLEVNTGYSIVFDPFDMNHVFLANTDVGLMESNDGGESWMCVSRKNNGIPRNWSNSTYWLVFDPEVRGKIWAVMSGTHDLPRPKMFRGKGTAGYRGGIVITEDGAKTWQPVSADIGEAGMTHILMDPASSKESRTLYACAFGKGVYKSVDGGRTWIQKNKGIPGEEPFAWRITRREKDGTLFLVVCRRSEDGSIGNDQDGALYRSDNGAESWTSVPLPEGTNGPMCLTIDPADSNRLLLSAWGRASKEPSSPDTGGGIFLSGDDGKTWKQVLGKDQHIHDITFDPRNNTFYACGFESSAYRSEDKGETWTRIKGFNFKWGKRVDPDPRDPEKIFVITFGGGAWYGPAKGDPSAVEDIITPVAAY